MTPDEARSSSKVIAASTTPAAATTPLSAAPLGQRPTLRMQDGDIILEDGALAAGVAVAPSPFASAATPNNHTALDQQEQQQQLDDLGKSPATPLPLGGEGDLSPMMVMHSSQLTVNSLQAQPSKPPTFNNNGAGSGAPTPTPDQARSATGGGVGSFRLHFDVVESVRGAKYRTTELTASNVQQLTKQQYGGESSKTSTTERMWRWLQDAGPPYEVHPSVGVPLKPPIHPTNAKSGTEFFACFKCFS
jgi:hypothetical protein